MIAKPERPPEPPDDSDYDDGDPYSCIAAGAAGVGGVTMKSRVSNCFDKKLGPEAFEELVREDLASVKVALYDFWDSGRYHKTMHALGTWAAEQMALLGDPSLVEYDKAVPPHQG